jgi:hypothetical protein
MFIDELQPMLKELIQQPIAFMGGFVTGALKLNLSEDPLKSWLEKQGINTYSNDSSSSSNGSEPQSINID